MSQWVSESVLLGSWDDASRSKFRAAKGAEPGQANAGGTRRLCKQGIRVQERGKLHVVDLRSRLRGCLLVSVPLEIHVVTSQRHGDMCLLCVTQLRLSRRGC